MRFLRVRRFRDFAPVIGSRWSLVLMASVRMVNHPPEIGAKVEVGSEVGTPSSRDHGAGLERSPDLTSTFRSAPWNALRRRTGCAQVNSASNVVAVDSSTPWFPGLHLTKPQVQDLWALDPWVCDASVRGR
jgi:hypothetical protein